MAAEVGERSAIAMAFAGRTVRACHVCATRSALWYCAADEAYLCTACDTQVHSANALSRRHERVRLAPNGTVPRKRPLQHSSLVPDEARKTSRPYAHHLRKLTRLSNQLVDSTLDPDSEPDELELNFADDDDEELLCDGNQEVPSVPSVPSPASSSSPDAELHDHTATTLAAFFKGKAAHSEHDQLPANLPVGTTNVVDDAFFFPGDIPGLDAFDGFTPPDLRDDFALSFDLALSHTTRLDAFEGTPGLASEPAELSDAGPFAKFFATKKTRDGGEEPMGAERIRREARAMLECCDGGAAMPALQLDLTGALAAWSGRGEPWMVDSSDSNSSGSDSAALVPDMDGDGDRDARVMRYKQKRRTRLFSNKIRYEVRKLNADRRPRMKGRFVKRSSQLQEQLLIKRQRLCFFVAKV